MQAVTEQSRLKENLALSPIHAFASGCEHVCACINSPSDCVWLPMASILAVSRAGDSPAALPPRGRGLLNAEARALSNRLLGETGRESRIRSAVPNPRFAAGARLFAWMPPELSERSLPAPACFTTPPPFLRKWPKLTGAFHALAVRLSTPLRCPPRAASTLI